jgi:hypothetical protein
MKKHEGTKVQKVESAKTRTSVAENEVLHEFYITSFSTEVNDFYVSNF